MRIIFILVMFLSTSLSAVERYSVNLMWINFYPAPFETKFMSDENINRVREWAKKTGDAAEVTVWYYGSHTTDAALSTTKDILARDSSAHDEWAKIRWQDVQNLPEVMENPAVFSDKTPGYFRSDLLRVIAAYNTLENDRTSVFVYADLDVTPMSKDEIFDEETEKNLRDFGIVLARGGYKGFENSFQITAYKENMQKALKTALIDISISRAANILSGGHWAYKPVGDTTPLTQTVYDTFDWNLLPYFYFLEGLVDLKVRHPSGVSLKDHLSSSAGRHIFGLDQVENLYLENMNERVVQTDESFGSRGEYFVNTKMKIPTKIIEAPPSRFGGQPEKYDPDKITPKNFKDKVQEAPAKLLAKLLKIAVRNNYRAEFQSLTDKLSPHEFTEAIVDDKAGDYLGDKISPLSTAVSIGSLETLEHIKSKIGSDNDLLARVGDALTVMSSQRYSILSTIPQKSKSAVFSFIVENFPKNDALIKAIGGVVLDDKDEDYVVFERIAKLQPSLLTERMKDNDTAAIIAARRGQVRTLKYIIANAPETFALVNSKNEAPLSFGYEMTSNLFKEIWKISTSVHSLKDSNAKNLAHRFAGESYSISMLKHLLVEAPLLFQMRDRFNQTPAESAANAGKAENLDAIATALPDVVRADFARVLEAAKNNYDCLKVLAKHFKDRIDDVVGKARSSRYVAYTAEQIEGLKRP